MFASLLEVLLFTVASGATTLTASGDLSDVDGADYHLDWTASTGAECVARNPAQALSASFTSDGLRITQESTHFPGIVSELRAASLARGGERSILPRAELCFDGPRVELDRGSVVEWYLNGPAGVEQGFTFAERPLISSIASESKVHEAMLEIGVEVRGDLSPRLGARGRSVDLCAADGRVVLSMGALYAYDARGVEQPAHFEVRAQEIVLCVDDRDAQYPLVVDPLIVAARTKFRAPDGMSLDFFGGAVSASGDSILIGAYGDDGPAGSNQGAAYVFVRDGASWTQQAKLIPSDAFGESYFGISVALDGDTAVVGAFARDGLAGTGQGAAYVFARVGTTWTEEAKLTASDAIAGDSFGISVAVQGDTIVVGAHRHDGTGGADQGQAYVFARSGGPWTEFARLTSLSSGPDDSFATTVAVDGPRVLVGAPFHDGPVAQDQGAAYVFLNVSGVYSEEAMLTASDPHATDLFGVSVDLDGDTAVVGSYLRDAAVLDQGAVYVFERGASWTQAAILTASEPMESDTFGSSVAIDGSMIAVGAESADGPGGGDDGAVYAFAKNGPNWSEQARLPPISPASSDSFGKSVDVSQALVVGGAYFDSHPGGVSQGSVTAFDVLVTPGFAYCFGDGQDPVVTAACPCGNTGNEGRGCRGSNSTLGGALLNASGQSQPNTVVFTVAGVPNRTLCTFLRGTVNLSAGFVFGDGVRCVAGSTLLFGQQKSGEGTNAPNTARAGTPTVAPGGTRYYQCMYRNPSPNFCTPEQFNMSNGYRIVW